MNPGNLPMHTQGTLDDQFERGPWLQPGLDFSVAGVVEEPARAPGGVWTIFYTFPAAGKSDFLHLSSGWEI